MSKVKIIYNGYPTIMQIQSNELLKEIFKKFKSKIKAENKELIFLYNGEIIKDEKISISKLTSEKGIIILACDSINMNSNDNNLRKTDYVICPICKESAKYVINVIKIIEIIHIIMNFFIVIYVK